MAEGLLWHAEEPYARYLTYIAPSWSWASMAGKISYFHERNQFPFESCVDIKDSVCEKSFLDPTGSVSGGHIRLIGEVVAVHLLVLSSSSAMILAGDPKTANPKSYVSKYHGGGGAFGSAYKDQPIFVYPLGTSMERHWEALCDERMPLTTACKLKDHCEQDFECIVESESERGYICLSIGRMFEHSHGRGRFRHWWLLLEAVPPRKQTYKRIGIGYFHWRTPDLFEHAIMQDVTIV